MDLINQTLLENIKNSISDVVPKKKIGIAFSGGVLITSSVTIVALAASVAVTLTVRQLIASNASVARFRSRSSFACPPHTIMRCCSGCERALAALSPGFPGSWLRSAHKVWSVSQGCQPVDEQHLVVHNVETI